MKKIIPYIILVTSLILLLFAFKIYSYLLFHTVAELFSVVIAFSIFVLVWNSRRFIQNNFYIFLGISFLFIAIIDFTHTLTYKGMQIFKGYDANLPTQIWIIARYMQSISILMAFMFIKRKLNHIVQIVSYSALTVICLALVFLNIFPDCFIDGKGLTDFKIISEYVISALLVFSIILLIKYKSIFYENLYRLMLSFIVLSIISELLFTLYSDVYGLTNMFGHITKIAAFYLLYLAIISTGYREPYKLIFRELKVKEKLLSDMSLTDDLTGLYNRRAAYDILCKNISLAKRNKFDIAISFMDLDKLKMINDQFGHAEGDKALQIFSRAVKEEIRNNDYLCRLGGDEFLLIFLNCGNVNIESIFSRISTRLNKFNSENPKDYKIEFSYGIEYFHSDDELDAETLIRRADLKMYDKKRK